LVLVRMWGRGIIVLSNNHVEGPDSFKLCLDPKKRHNFTGKNQPMKSNKHVSSSTIMMTKLKNNSTAQSQPTNMYSTILMILTYPRKCNWFAHVHNKYDHVVNLNLLCSYFFNVITTFHQKVLM
jgi:hypothetical protein